MKLYADIQQNHQQVRSAKPELILILFRNKNCLRFLLNFRTQSSSREVHLFYYVFVDYYDFSIFNLDNLDEISHTTLIFPRLLLLVTIVFVLFSL